MILLLYIFFIIITMATESVKSKVARIESSDKFGIPSAAYLISKSTGYSKAICREILDTYVKEALWALERGQSLIMPSAFSLKYKPFKMKTALWDGVIHSEEYRTYYSMKLKGSFNAAYKKRLKIDNGFCDSHGKQVFITDAYKPGENTTL